MEFSGWGCIGKFTENKHSQLIFKDSKMISPFVVCVKCLLCALDFGMNRIFSSNFDLFSWQLKFGSISKSRIKKYMTSHENIMRNRIRSSIQIFNNLVM